MFTIREQRRIVKITQMLYKRYGDTMTVRDIATERLTRCDNAVEWVRRHGLDRYCKKPMEYPVWIVAAQIVKGRKSLCTNAKAVDTNSMNPATTGKDAATMVTR